MNNFSGYQGLPNLSTIVADDLDISNLVVDTITVNTELKTNNIQPLASNDDIDIGTNTNTGTINLNQDTVATNLEVSNILVVDNIQPSTTINNIVIGTNTNTGIIDIQQNVDVNGDIEADNITANTQLNTNSIQPLNSNDIITIGDQFNTGYIAVEQDIIQNGNITTNSVIANNQLFTNLITAQTSIDNLVIGDNSWTGIIDIQQDVDINADLEADNITINTSFKTNSIEPKTNANPVVLYSAQTSTCALGNTANTNPIRMNQNVSIGTNTNTRQLNVSNEQNTANNNYLLLLNTDRPNRENGIQIRNQNGGVFLNEWYIYTPINSSDLRFYTNGADRITLSSAGNMTFATGGQIFMPSNGPIYTLFIRNSGAVTGSSQLYDTTTTGTINFGTGLTSGQILMGNSTQTGRVIVRCNFDVGSNASQKGISCAYYQAYDPANTVSLFPTNTTGIINFGQALTTANINIHNTGGSGSINLNANTVLATGKSLTFSTTSDLKVNSIQPINVGDTTNIMTTSTAQINIGNPASVSALAISNTISMASAKNIYLPNTNQRIECNNFESFTVSNPVEMYRLLTGTWKLGNSANTNKIEFYQDIDLSTSNKALYVNGISTIDPTQFLQIGQSTDTSYVQIERNTYIFTGKTLFSDTQNATAGAGGTVNLYNAITTGSINLGTGQTTGNINIGNVSATSGLINLNNNVVIPSTESLALTTITGNTVSSAVALFNNITTGSINLGTGQTTGNINIGNVSATSGLINLNNNVVIPSTESLAVTTINSNGTGLSLSLGGNILTNSVNIGAFITSGAVNIGNSSAVGCKINMNSDAVFAIGKNIELDTSSKISTAKIEGYGALSLTIGNNITTLGSISMGTGLTTQNLTLGGAGTTGRVIIGNQSATPSSGNGHITAYNRIHNPYSGGAFMFNVNSGTNLFNLTTSGALGGKQLTTTMYANAPTSNFNCIEGNSGSEGCAWLMNGDTSIIVNPADNESLWFADEDSFTTANNWAWVGWKMSTAGVITASSDRRTKRDITPIVKENLLETLSKVQFVNYKKKAPTEEKYYKNGEFRRKYKEVHMGVIAQDVRQAGLPEVCQKENEDAYWTVKYQDLGLYFNMGVQELIAENKALKERVSKMENFLKSKYPDFE